MGMFKKPLLSQKKKDEPSVEVKIMQTRAKLDQISKKYKMVIETEARNIRYNRVHNTSVTSDEKSVKKIKTAYYAMNIVNQAKVRLVDIETSEQLASALNQMTAALKSINQLYGHSEKVHARKLNKEIGKMQGGTDSSEKQLEKVFRKREDFDEVVSDDVVERLIKGESVDKCIQVQEGIQADLTEALGEDWLSQMGDGGLDFENIDLEELNF